MDTEWSGKQVTDVERESRSQKAREGIKDSPPVMDGVGDSSVNAHLSSHRCRWVTHKNKGACVHVCVGGRIHEHAACAFHFYNFSFKNGICLSAHMKPPNIRV